MTFDEVPADLAEESIKVQYGQTDYCPRRSPRLCPACACSICTLLPAPAGPCSPALSQASRPLFGICMVSGYRLPCFACLGDLHATACTSVVGVCCLAIPLHACSLSTSARCLIKCGGPGLFVCSLCRVLPAQAATSFVKGAASQHCMVASLPAWRLVNSTADATACCCRWRCTTMRHCCQTTSSEELRSATPAVPKIFNAWGAIMGHHVHATALAFYPGA